MSTNKKRPQELWGQYTYVSQMMLLNPMRGHDVHVAFLPLAVLLYGVILLTVIDGFSALFLMIEGGTVHIDGRAYDQAGPVRSFFMYLTSMVGIGDLSGSKTTLGSNFVLSVFVWVFLAFVVAGVAAVFQAGLVRILQKVQLKIPGLRNYDVFGVFSPYNYGPNIRLWFGHRIFAVALLSFWLVMYAEGYMQRYVAVPYHLQLSSQVIKYYDKRSKWENYMYGQQSEAVLSKIERSRKFDWGKSEYEEFVRRLKEADARHGVESNIVR